VAALPPALAAFAHRDYRWLWAGTFFSTAAQWIQQATLGWVIYDLTGSAALLGAILGVRAVPMLLLAPVSGLVADRFDRRRALALSQIAPAVMTLSLAVLLALNAVEVWHLFAFTLIASSGMVFERTLRNTLVFDVVPREEAANAIALNTIAFSISRTLGPAIGGILIAAIGPAWNFAIQGVTYVGVAASVLMITVRHRHAGHKRKPAWQAMYEGLHFAATDPIARMMLIVGLIPPLLLIPSFSALMPIFAADIFQVGPQGLGLLLSAVGVGGIVGGVIAAAASRYDRVGRLQMVSLLVFTACVIGFAVSPNMATALVFLTVIGVVEMTAASSTHSTLQMRAPENMRGQVTSLLPMFPACIAIGSFAAGLGTQFLGVQTQVIATALLAAVVFGLAWTRSAPYRALRMADLIARK